MTFGNSCGDSSEAGITSIMCNTGSTLATAAIDPNEAHGYEDSVDDSTLLLESWACNPRVLELLGRAREQLESGAMTDKEMEHHLVAQLKVSVICFMYLTLAHKALPPCLIEYLTASLRRWSGKASSFMWLRQENINICVDSRALGATPRPSSRPSLRAVWSCPPRPWYLH